ncbi:MAG: ABC transporter permease [Anaerobiospirillum sp.]|nr:ABC transporter permease [Anaerobiospirillum sp.]
MLAITAQPVLKSTTGFKLSAAATGLFFVLVLTGPIWYGLLTGYDPYTMDISQSLAGPSLEHPLGCDRLGRDQLMRLLWGSYYSLPLAAALIISATVAGTLIGLTAALRGGILARIFSATVNVLMAFPQQLAVILLLGMLGMGLTHSVFALALFWWVHFAQLTYTRTRALLKEEYIRAAKLAGESTFSLVRYYLLPQLKDQLLLTALLDFSAAILALATLSFLGLATQPPIPEWGSMLYESQPYLQNAPHLLIGPLLFIFLSALCCNLMALNFRQVKSC